MTGLSEIIDFFGVSPTDIDPLINSDWIGKHPFVADFMTAYGQVSVDFDVADNIVAQIIVSDDKQRYPVYRWTEQNLRRSARHSHESRGIDHDKSFCDVHPNYADTDELWDILDKAKAILENRSFDPDVIMTFELDEGFKEKITDIAFRRGITFDQFITEAVTNAANEVLQMAKTQLHININRLSSMHPETFSVEFDTKEAADSLAHNIHATLQEKDVPFLHIQNESYRVNDILSISTKVRQD